MRARVTQETPAIKAQSAAIAAAMASICNVEGGRFLRSPEGPGSSVPPFRPGPCPTGSALILRFLSGRVERRQAIGDDDLDAALRPCAGDLQVVVDRPGRRDFLPRADRIARSHDGPLT